MIFQSLKEHFKYNQENLEKKINKIFSILNELRKKHFNNYLLLQNEIDFLSNNLNLCY